MFNQVVVGEVDDKAEQRTEPELRIVDAKEVADKLVELGSSLSLHLGHVEALVGEALTGLIRLQTLEVLCRLFTKQKQLLNVY